MRDNLRAALTALWTGLGKWFRLADLVFLASVGAVFYGIAKIYEPLAWIFTGGLFIVLTTWGKFRGDRS